MSKYKLFDIESLISESKRIETNAGEDAKLA